jgi:hypothetical protein
MTVRELTLLIFSLESEYKVGILSSLITVIGFIYAFHMSGESWRRQMREEQKFKAASEIEDFFYRVLNTSYTLERYAEGLVSLVEMRSTDGLTARVEMEIRIMIAKTQAFLEARAEMSEFSVDVHGVIGRNDGALSVGWGLKDTAQRAATEIALISKSMWFNVPIVDFDKDAWAEIFIAQIDVQASKGFIIVAQNSQTQISGMSGAIKGYLHSYVWGVNGAGLLSWLTDAKGKIKAFKEFRRKL